jgi:hypothetical protein
MVLKTKWPGVNRAILLGENLDLTAVIPAKRSAEPGPASRGINIPRVDAGETVALRFRISASHRPE